MQERLLGAVGRDNPRVESQFEFSGQQDSQSQAQMQEQQQRQRQTAVHEDLSQRLLGLRLGSVSTEPLPAMTSATAALQQQFEQGVGLESSITSATSTNGFVTPSTTYAPEVAQYVRSTFYESAFAPDSSGFNTIPGISSVRPDRGVHSYPMNRERVERGYR